MMMMMNSSIKYQSFVYIQLNGQTVLFLTIQLSISRLLSQFKCQTVLFDPLIGPYQVLPLRVRVDIGTMAIKEYSTFPKPPALQEPHHQIVKRHQQDTHRGEVLPTDQDAVCVFYSPTPNQLTVLEKT